MDRAPYDPLFRALESALLEQGSGGRWFLVSPLPGWLGRSALSGPAVGATDPPEFVPGEGPTFLESFLEEASEHWGAGRSAPLSSLPWCERDAAGREWGLQALALVLPADRHVVLIEWLSERYQELESILQRARAGALEFDALQREVLKKEVLLHCIVHDLRVPLASIVGGLSLLRSDGRLRDQERHLVELGLEAARRQEALIRQVLEVFAAELDELQSFSRSGATAPDLAQVLGSVLRTYAPVARQLRVRLESSWAAQRREPLRVVGRADRLERVLANLIDNALRHSPAGEAVEIDVEEDAGSVRLVVEDRGRGVPEALQPKLFERFGRAGDRPPGSGLGLFYCKQTVEPWGGAIGYEPRRPQGSRFWFRLPRAV
jgi:signal transduction histidine kinase